jgi:hypothetical protein
MVPSSQQSNSLFKYLQLATCTSGAGSSFVASSGMLMVAEQPQIPCLSVPLLAAKWLGCWSAARQCAYCC